MIVNRNGDSCWSEKRNEFEENKKIYESVLLKFTGVKENEDVYNCSIPFTYNGKKYIFGRVEPHDKWATSRIYIFEETAKDTYSQVENVISYQLEDPFFTIIDNELVLGGVNVKDIEIPEKCAIVIGNEGRGISDSVRDLCDKFIYISMNGDCESLNAAVAASIIMYEVKSK